MTSRAKWAGTALQIAGVFAMSSRLAPPWAAFMIMFAGSLVWSSAAVLTRDWPAATLNLAFVGSNLLGIWRWTQ